MTHLASLRSYLRSPLLVVHHCWNARFSYIMSLLLLMQRTPVIRHLLELPKQLAPRFADILRIVIPVSVGAGTTHSVTGATGVIPVNPSANPAQTKVGEPFTWVFRTTGEKAKSYSFAGLPPGVVHSGVVQNAVSSIGGTPATPGDYRVSIIGWEKKGQGGRKTPVYTLTMSIEGGAIPPEILDHPLGGIYNEGGAAVLSANAQGEGLTYQWKKDGQPLSGTSTVGSDLTFVALAPTDAGVYSVEVSNGGGLLTSQTAELQVRMAGRLDYWQAEYSITDPLGDPDGDGLTNLVEYGLGGDPHVSGPEGVPTLLLEQVSGGVQLVAEFQVATDAIDCLLQVESTADLSDPTWVPVSDVSVTGNRLTATMPADQAYHFLRLTVSKKP
jgi:hypothetical protein